jgi:hypothetical protein
MKTLNTLGICTAVFWLLIKPLSAQVVAPSVVSPGLANGLDGYWTFDETSGGIAHDSSGNGFNGTLVSYPINQGTWTSGKVGGALQFGGPNTHQYVQVPNFSMPTASMTLTAWVWANTTPSWATIAANWNGAWGAFNYSTFGSTPNMSLYVADGGSPPGIVNVDYGVSSTSLSVNQWHFLAFVANSQTATVTFMQDGVVTGGFGYGGQLFASSSQLNIGDDPSDTSPGQGYWDGKIDDLAIWTRALSSSELTGIYNAGLAGQSLLTLIPEPSVPALLSLGIFAVAGVRSRCRCRLTR